MVKGWMGKPKGILQVLQERIFIDTSKDVCTNNTLIVQVKSGCSACDSG